MGIVSVTEQRNKKSDNVFERIRDDVLVHVTNTMPMEAVEWFSCNLDFNVSDGKSNSIMSVVDFVEILRGRTLSDDEYFKATLLEWCIKLVQASRSYIYSGDKPNKRRKQQCWYAGDDIVLKDSLWLDVVMYFLLKKYFRTETYYVHLLELFQDTTFQVEMGHLVNFITASRDHSNLSKFSLQRYALITRSKIASFYLPVALAMCICGVPESYGVNGTLFYPYATSRSILLRLGEYFQVQDDFLNYVGAPERVGKTKSDITENKCSWCISVALVVSSPEERKVLEENYGQLDAEKQSRVERIYETIGLREQYQAYEARLRALIEELIAEIPEADEDVDANSCVLNKEVFSSFLNEICTRAK